MKPFSNTEDIKFIHKKKNPKKQQSVSIIKILNP